MIYWIWIPNILLWYSLVFCYRDAILKRIMIHNPYVIEWITILSIVLSLIGITIFAPFLTIMAVCSIIQGIRITFHRNGKWWPPIKFIVGVKNVDQD